MLLGKTIVVTGAASGIGERVASLIASLGADVIGLDINAPPHPVGEFLKIDISSASSIEAATSLVPNQIDALCNVAGLSGKIGAAKTLAVNFYGLRALSEALAPRIREAGSVVNIASVAGHGWRANLARAKEMVAFSGFPDIQALLRKFSVADEEGYPLSKELLLLWTMQAAHQPAFKSRRIRVNAVSPGPVITPILSEFRAVFGDARVDDDIARVGRAGTAADVAPVVAFLCSDGARWINGANVPVDGGLEASINATVLEF